MVDAIYKWKFISCFMNVLVGVLAEHGLTLQFLCEAIGIRVYLCRDGSRNES